MGVWCVRSAEAEIQDAWGAQTPGFSGKAVAWGAMGQGGGCEAGVHRAGALPQQDCGSRGHA